ncbi:hypothetical protein PENTCL1PPCAC_13894, partial [Pristionchus entomophagus]
SNMLKKKPEKGVVRLKTNDSSGETIEQGIKDRLRNYGRFTAGHARDEIVANKRNFFNTAATKHWFPVAKDQLNEALEIDDRSLDYPKSCVTDPRLLAYKTMPKIYVPPSVRTVYRDPRFDGPSSYYNDVGDDYKAPEFNRIDTNKMIWKPDGPLELTIHCSCQGVCSDQCECRRHCTYAYIHNGRIVTKDSAFFFQQVYACSSRCRCDTSCGNRIDWKEEENQLEVVRRIPEMGFEVRALRAFDQGEVVMEFTGEITEYDEKEVAHRDYSFVVYDSKLPSHSEQVFKGNYPRPIHFQKNQGKICINPAGEGGIGRFVGHSNMPNVLPIRVYTNGSYIGAPRLLFIALFTIPAGAFVKVDYGEDRTIEGYCLCDELLCHDLPTLANLLPRNLGNGRITRNFVWDLMAFRQFYNQDRTFMEEMRIIHEMYKKNGGDGVDWMNGGRGSPLVCQYHRYLSKLKRVEPGEWDDEKKNSSYGDDERVSHSRKEDSSYCDETRASRSRKKARKENKTQENLSRKAKKSWAAASSEDEEERTTVLLTSTHRLSRARTRAERNEMRSAILRSRDETVHGLPTSSLRETRPSRWYFGRGLSPRLHIVKKIHGISYEVPETMKEEYEKMMEYEDVDEVNDERKKSFLNDPFVRFLVEWHDSPNREEWTIEPYENIRDYLAWEGTPQINEYLKRRKEEIKRTRKRKEESDSEDPSYHPSGEEMKRKKTEKKSQKRKNNNESDYDQDEKAGRQRKRKVSERRLASHHSSDEESTDRLTKEERWWREIAKKENATRDLRRAHRNMRGKQEVIFGGNEDAMPSWREETEDTEETEEREETEETDSERSDDDEKMRKERMDPLLDSEDEGLRRCKDPSFDSEREEENEVDLYISWMRKEIRSCEVKKKKKKENRDEDESRHIIDSDGDEDTESAAKACNKRVDDGGEDDDDIEVVFANGLDITLKKSVGGSG